MTWDSCREVAAIMGLLRNVERDVWKNSPRRRLQNTAVFVFIHRGVSVTSPRCFASFTAVNFLHHRDGKAEDFEMIDCECVAILRSLPEFRGQPAREQGRGFGVASRMARWF